MVVRLWDMTKQVIKKVGPNATLVRCTRTGIAWVEDGRSGARFSAHPNISDTGSVRGMKANGYWGKTDRTVRTHGFIFNIDHSLAGDKYSQYALNACSCGGNHGGARK